MGAVLTLGVGTTVGSGIFSSLYLEDGGQYVYFREAGPPVLLNVGEAEPEGSLIPA